MTSSFSRSLSRALACGARPRQEAVPHRGVDQHHYAARRLRAGRSRRLGASSAAGSDPRSARRRPYAACRKSASRPSRTASVSVAAPLTVRASAKSFSSMCSVFFIPCRTAVPLRRLNQLRPRQAQRLLQPPHRARQRVLLHQTRQHARVLRTFGKIERRRRQRHVGDRQHHAARGGEVVASGVEPAGDARAADRARRGSRRASRSSATSFAAVFSPMPFTPGRPSDGSPRSSAKSPIARDPGCRSAA